MSDRLFAWAIEADGRSRRGRRWPIATPLVKAVLVGMLAGCKNLLDVERLIQAMPGCVREKLGIPTGLSDTTLRDFLTKLDVDVLQNMLWTVGYDAVRRKALRPRPDLPLPFGVISADGKYPSTADTGDYKYLQVHHQDGVATHGLLRTITCCLISALGQPILGAVPVRGNTNEQGGFAKAFGDIVRIFGRHFRLFMYDAGAASQTNADCVRAAGKDYLFLIADPRWQMYQTVELLLRDKKPTYSEAAKRRSAHEEVVRHLTLLPIAARNDGLFWEHTRTLVRIVTERYRHGELVSTETRYAVTSLASNTLTPKQFLALMVARWGVETAHCILDTTFEEDDRPWIRTNAQGALAVQILRRVAFTLLTLYKHVTLRNEAESRQPWSVLMESIRDALKSARPEDLEGLRQRTFAVPPALA